MRDHKKSNISKIFRISSINLQIFHNLWKKKANALQREGITK